MFQFFFFDGNTIILKFVLMKSYPLVSSVDSYLFFRKTCFLFLDNFRIENPLFSNYSIT